MRTTQLSNPRFPEKRGGSCWEGPEQTASSWGCSGPTAVDGRAVASAVAGDGEMAFYSVDHEAIRNLPHVVTCGQRLKDARSLERPILSGVEFQHWHRLLKEETCAS